MASRDEYSMPFHPACFDIFTRLSRQNFNGQVDLNGLMGWFYLEHSYDQYHPDVKRSSSQWWHHTAGNEYLAANPLSAQGLDIILKSALTAESDFSTQFGAFAVPEIFPTEAEDIFKTLPEELRLEVVSYLASKDIASLRLSSRIFRQLPIHLWHRLLREEMPWLWEVWTMDEPYKWAIVPFTQIQKDRTEEDAVKEKLEMIFAIIREELPELMDKFKEGGNALLTSRPDIVSSIHRNTMKAMIWKLPPTKTNWYKLYTCITRHWSDLKGLQNRARIWKDVEEIIIRIKSYRHEGQILD